MSLEETSKTFHSYKQFEKECFPKMYNKEKLKKLIEQKGWGPVLAEMFLKSIKKELEKV